MFSGLIAHRGRVIEVRREPVGGLALVLEAPEALAEGVAVKDSIAVNGVCLTVVACDARTMRFDVVPETVTRSTLGALGLEDRTNLELSLRLGDRLGGHLVYGHVDAVTTIVSVVPEGRGTRVRIATPEALRRYVVEKGYVAIDGVSLTVAAVARDAFEIALIPESAARTTLGEKRAGAKVNFEIDPIARYALAEAEAYAPSPASEAAEIAWAYEI